MIDRKEASAFTRFRLWFKTFIESVTIDQKYENVHYIRPSVEGLEERALMSASPVSSLPIFSLASPPPAPSVSAVTSYMGSVMNEWGQLIDTAQQEVIGVWKAIGQGIAQETSFIEQQFDQVLGIHPVASTTTLSTVVVPSAPGSGQGHGVASGSGSGSGAMTTGQDSNTQPTGTFRAMDISGSGTGSGPSSGSSGATVTGQIWLDNDDDGSIDENEMDYSGAQVTLLYQVSSGGGTTWSTLASTTTNGNLTGNNYSISAVVPPGSSYTCKIEVAIPLDFGDEAGGYENDIDAQGFSPVFTLSSGGMEVVGAALDSMNVNTLSDDQNGVVQQNKVTLRDAIKTGNKGPAFPAVTFDGAGNGTIILQKPLDSIAKSFDINGTGASTLTVDGNNSAGTIFTVNAGVTSAISGLTITGGAGGNGGGIYNQGNLTLNGIVLNNNQTAGNGGGIYNDSDAELTLQTVTIGTIANPNKATQAGGGLYNLGNVTICCDSAIIGNTAGGGGGGIYNYEGTIQAFDGTQINFNGDAGLRGGGVYNNTGKFEMHGGYIADNQETKADGGGVYNYFGTATLTGVAVLGNRAIGYGGGLYTNEGSLTLTNNGSIGSIANGDTNFAQRGGGVFVNGSVVKMTGGAITNNTATASTGGVPPLFSGGGGLFVNAGSVTLTNVSISNNGSKAAGAGIYVRSGSLKLINDVISYNVNSIGNGSFGGGMFINGGTVTVSGGTFKYNVATQGAGGGIYNYAGSLTLNSLVLPDNTFPVLILNNAAFSNGGGMFLANNSKTTFNDASVSGNTTWLNTQTTGRGVFEQQFATVNIPGVLNDKDDDGGVPYRTGLA